MKYLAYYIILFSTLGFAITFDKTFNYLGSEAGKSVKATKDGGFIIAGSTRLAGIWWGDGCLIKTDQNGVVEWEETYGDTLNEYFVSVDQTLDEGFIAVGSTDNGGIPGDFLMVKYDKHGKEKWSVSFEDSTRNYIASKVMVDSISGDIIVVGSVWDDPAASPNDAWIMKTDASGNIEWSRKYDRFNLINKAKNIIKVESGYLVCGSAERLIYNGPFIIPEYSAVPQGWVFLINDDGNVVYEFLANNNFRSYFNSIILNSDNSIIATGYREVQYSVDLALVKISSSFHELWQVYHEDIAFVYGSCLSFTNDGNYVVLGTKYRLNGNEYDILLMKFDNEGTEIWQKYYGETESDWAGESLIQLSDGFVFTGTVNLNYDYEFGDICLIKTDSDGYVIYPPTITSFKNDSNNVSINWDPVSNAGSYIVYNSDRVDSNFVPVDTTSVNTWNTTAVDSLKKKFYFIKASTNGLK